MSAADQPVEARYEALLFDPTARPSVWIVGILAAIGLASTLFTAEQIFPMILALIVAPGLILAAQVEWGEWLVDKTGVRERLRPLAPFLSQRAIVIPWEHIDGYRLEAGVWVPRFLKLMKGDRPLLTIYEVDDDAKREAFERFASTFAQLASARGIVLRSART